MGCQTCGSQVVTRSTSAAAGLQYVDCGPGYSLLSCGVDNNPAPASDNYRYAIPSTSKTCACYDLYGCLCITWCTNVPVPGFEIAVSGRQTGVFTVSCSVGKNVIGCHVIPSFIALEGWRQYYPSSSGSCTCYNNSGGVCVATCASDIASYEIRQIFGYGVVNVNCLNQNTYVLRCGIKPLYPVHDYERWRFMHVGDSRSCQCYDHFGLTCYAICWRF